MAHIHLKLLKVWQQASKTGPANLGFFLALNSLLWGLLLLFESSKFTAVSGIFYLLSFLLPLWVWAAIFILVGIVQIYSIFVAAHKMRVMVSFVTFLLWLFITIVDVLPDGITPTTFMFSMMFFGEWLVWLTLTVVYGGGDEHEH